MKDVINASDSNAAGGPSFDGTVNLIISLFAAVGSPVTKEMIAEKIDVKMEKFNHYLADNAPQDVFDQLRKEYSSVLNGQVRYRVERIVVPPDDPRFGQVHDSEDPAGK